MCSVFSRRVAHIDDIYRAATSCQFRRDGALDIDGVMACLLVDVLRLLPGVST
jgi:hypothetical protein